MDSPDRRVSGAGAFSFANTGSGDIVGIEPRALEGFLSCHRAMSPVLLYRIA